MRYLIVDAALSGAGIRDKYEGGYMEPVELRLGGTITGRLRDWMSRYEAERYSGFQDSSVVADLDLEGQEIAIMIKNEMVDVKVEYFSEARLTRTML